MTCDDDAPHIGNPIKLTSERIVGYYATRRGKLGPQVEVFME